MDDVYWSTHAAEEDYYLRLYLEDLVATRAKQARLMAAKGWTLPPLADS
ncbi:MAG: hypothetical protein AAGN66_27950 [Acidobacteriota bacterium]